jgi:hypothetical protein
MGMHLMGVYVMGVYPMSRVCLMGMYLMGGHLMGVSLMSVHLVGVYLTGMHFTSMHLMGVYLMGMQLGYCLLLVVGRKVQRCRSILNLLHVDVCLGLQQQWSQLSRSNWRGYRGPSRARSGGGVVASRGRVRGSCGVKP